MARGNKQDDFAQICAQLNVPFNESWKSRGSTITTDGFEAALEQIAKDTGIPPTYFSEYEALVCRLIHKSLEGMVLALEVINKPSIGYRLEAFLFLFINAWELLLKAKLVHENKNTAVIYDSSNPKRTITFEKALKTVFPASTNPVRMNLLQIEALRNGATHLFIGIVPPNVLQVCQAGILNYETSLSSWLGRSLRSRIPRGMMFLVSELDPQTFSLASPVISKHVPAESIRYLKQWQDAVKTDIESLPEDQISQYVVRIDLNLALVNNQSKADVIASLDPQAASSAAVAVKIQPLTHKYPLSHNELVAMVKAKRPGAKLPAIYAIMAKCGIRGDPKYSAYNWRGKYQEDRYNQTKVLPKGVTVIYNAKAVDYIVAQIKPAADTVGTSEQAPIAPIDPAPSHPGDSAARMPEQS